MYNALLYMGIHRSRGQILFVVRFSVGGHMQMNILLIKLYGMFVFQILNNVFLIYNNCVYVYIYI
jgi:hypothetical protein